MILRKFVRSTNYRAESFFYTPVRPNFPHERTLESYFCYTERNGLLDRIVERKDMRETLASILALHNTERANVSERGTRG